MFTNFEPYRMIVEIIMWPVTCLETRFCIETCAHRMWPSFPTQTNVFYRHIRSQKSIASPLVDLASNESQTLSIKMCKRHQSNCGTFFPTLYVCILHTQSELFKESFSQHRYIIPSICSDVWTVGLAHKHKLHIECTQRNVQSFKQMLNRSSQYRPRGFVGGA